MKAFDWSILSAVDYAIAKQYVPDLRVPELVIDYNGKSDTSYLYRWHVIPQNQIANIYFHIQTADDPERPLHDHPWDNQSVILSGGYYEDTQFGRHPGLRQKRVKGDVVHRLACYAHRLTMLPDTLYTMTQFSTGPKIRKWGFHIGDKWVAYEECCTFVDNRTLFRWPERFKHLNVGRD